MALMIPVRSHRYRISSATAVQVWITGQFRLLSKVTASPIRWTDQGKQFPAPSGAVQRATWIGAGYPDYPWIFGTDAEYTAFAAVSLGQFDAIKGHLRALREISDILKTGPAR